MLALLDGVQYQWVKASFLKQHGKAFMEAGL